MNPSNLVALVELVTHTSTSINGQNVVLLKREWVRSDDPRLAPPLVRFGGHFVEKSIDEKTGRTIISALRLVHRNIGDQESLAVRSRAKSRDQDGIIPSRSRKDDVIIPSGSRRIDGISRDLGV